MINKSNSFVLKIKYVEIIFGKKFFVCVCSGASIYKSKIQFGLKYLVAFTAFAIYLNISWAKAKQLLERNSVLKARL